MVRPMATAARRVLDLRFIVLVNIAAIFSLRSLTEVARLGWGALTMTAIAFAIFFVPLTLAVVALSARYPEEGGLYRWTQTAFGPTHGFVCGWAYFVNNLVFFPQVLTHVAVLLPWVVTGRAGDQGRLYVVAVGLAGLWGLGVLPNVLGARRTGQASAAGVIGSMIGVAVLAGLAVVAAVRGAASATPTSTWLPSVGGSDLAMLSSLPFLFAGLELAPTMGDEVKDARRTLVRGALIAGALLTLMFFAGLTAIVLALRPEEIGLADGIPAAVAALSARIGAPAVLVQLIAACLVLAAIGQVVVWMAGSARLVRAAGVDRAMPAWFTREHPRLGTPVEGLVAQGVAASLLLLASVAGSSVGEAYAVLRSVTQVVYYLPFLYLFASHVRLAPPELRGRAWLVGGVGFVTTLLGVAAAVVPPREVTDLLLFEIKVIGGAALLVVAGLPLYLTARRGDDKGKTRSYAT